jgi:hypothetical protein
MLLRPAMVGAVCTATQADGSFSARYRGAALARHRGWLFTASVGLVLSIRSVVVAVVATYLGTPSPSAAQSALVHVQGEPGSREAYYANFAVVSDRTPIDKLNGPTQVRQLDTTIVYEAANKPEWSQLRLQFECVVKYPYDGKTIPKQPPFDAPVRVRMGEGGVMLRREDLKGETLPAGDWRTSASPVLLKLHKIACHEDVLRGALVKASKNNNDLAVFRQEIKKIGLPEDLQLLAQSMSTEFMDFSWWVLWNGAKRPDPTGKWSRRATQEELTAYQAMLDEALRKVEGLAGQLTPKLEAGIDRLDKEFDFQAAAARVRGWRATSKNERSMLAVWVGKPETEVGAALGAPLVSSAGKLRFLSYGKEFDNRVLVGNRKGAVWEEGVYEHCNVQFVMMADSKGLMRVADVRVWAQSSQFGQVVFACTGLLEVPR